MDEASAEVNCGTNDTYQCAEKVELNTRVSGSFSGNHGEKYYYRVKVPSSGQLLVTLNPVPNDKHSQAFIYDAEYNRITYKSYDAGQPGTLSAKVSPGTFYVVVFAYSQDPFKVAVQFEGTETERIGPAVASPEAQPAQQPASASSNVRRASASGGSAPAAMDDETCQANNSFDCAAELPMDLRMGGTFAAGDRTRVYRMVVPQKGTLALTLDPAPKDSWTMMKVLNREKESLGAHQFNAGETGTYEIEVEPGLVYVEVFNEQAEPGTAFGLHAALPKK